MPARAASARAGGASDAVRRAFYRRSAKAAVRVLTDSAFSAAEITAAYDIPIDRVAIAIFAAASKHWNASWAWGSGWS